MMKHHLLEHVKATFQAASFRRVLGQLSEKQLGLTGELTNVLIVLKFC